MQEAATILVNFLRDIGCSISHPLAITFIPMSVHPFTLKQANFLTTPDLSKTFKSCILPSHPRYT